MAVQDELEAILARLLRMREELKIEVVPGVHSSGTEGDLSSAPVSPPSQAQHQEEV
jgi:hypothetical protein